MTEGQLRDALRSMTGSLDELRREHGWREVERAIASPRQGDQAPRKPWRYVVVPLVALGVIAALAWPRSSEPPVVREDPPTTLVVGAGERAVVERDGVTLTLIGPGSATVRATSASELRVEVASGTLLSERASDDSPPIAIAAGGNTTTTRDAAFAIRVEPGMVVFGAGDRARVIVERATFEPRQPAPPQPTPQPSPRPSPQPSPRPTPQPSLQPTPQPTLADTPADSSPPSIPEIAVDAKELYARAEAALAVRDRAIAKQHLQRLLIDYPTDPLIDSARYDLALIAIADHELATARELIRQLIDSARDPALRSAAAKLRAKLR